jgi:prophage antirepressor-like protein
MDIVNAFNTNNLHTEIVIKGTTDVPLFRASDIGEILEMSNIRASILEFDDSEKCGVNTIDTTGRIQNITFLTEKGLYKVLFKSRKPIAQKFQGWVCDVIKEIRLNGFYDLQKQLEQQKTELEKLEEKKKLEYEIKLEKEKVLEREKMLLKEYGTIGSIVYIVKVKSYENGQYVIKIGESRRGITNRYNEHKTKYEECLLLDCFTVNKSKDFESFIHNHENIRGNKVTDLNGHESELELFLIGKNLTYQMLLNIINNNIKYFNNYDMSKLELENENLKLMLEMKNTNNLNPELQEITKLLKQLSAKIDNLENKTNNIIEKTNTQNIKTSTGFKEPLVTLGPRVQKINPENLQIVKIYESASEVMKENSNIKRPSLSKAVSDNTIYYGFRWLFVDRELDPNIIHNIQPTKQTKVQNLGYIAKLNSEKTEIINVYLDRKTAAHYNDYESTGALDIPVRNNTLTKGFYYKLYHECNEDLRFDFEQKINGTPILYKNGIGRYDLNNNLVAEFISKKNCTTSLSISDKTLNKALTKKIQYNGFFYKEMGTKLKCL